MEMDNSALIQWGTEKYSFQRMPHGSIIFMVEMYDSNRNHVTTSYVLNHEGKIVKEISREQEFIKTGYLEIRRPIEEIEKETIEIRHGLSTHWPTAKELRRLLEAIGYVGIEVKGDGLFMRLLLEGEKAIVETMKEQPQIFFEIEKRLIPYIDPEKASTVIVKALKP